MVAILICNSISDKAVVRAIYQCLDLAAFSRNVT